MYNSHLAEIHDRWFSDLANHAATHLIGNVPSLTGPVTDLGCGSGTLLSRLNGLIEKGYGFDISPEMILLAKSKSPSFHFEVGDILNVSIPQSQVVCMVGEILSYATADITQPKKVIEDLFVKIAHSLSPQGIIIFDFLKEGTDFNYQRTFDTDACNIRVKSNHEGHLVIREIRSRLRGQESVEVHKQQTFDVGMIIEILESVGLTVELIDKYSNYSLSKGRQGCWCQLNAKPNI